MMIKTWKSDNSNSLLLQNIDWLKSSIAAVLIRTLYNILRDSFTNKSTEICTIFFRLTLVNLMWSIYEIIHIWTAIIDESEEMIIALNVPI